MDSIEFGTTVHSVTAAVLSELPKKNEKILSVVSIVVIAN